MSCPVQKPPKFQTAVTRRWPISQREILR